MTPHTLRHALNRAHYSTLEPGYRVNGSTPLSAVSCCIFFGCIAGACSLGQWAPGLWPTAGPLACFRGERSSLARMS